MRRIQFPACPHVNPRLALALIACAWLVSCGAPRSAAPPREVTPGPLPPGAGEKLRVVATTSIIADVVRRIGGDGIELTTLIALGVDPHTYVATPSDSAAVHDAHLLFSNGAGLEEGISDLTLSPAGGAIQIPLSDALPLLFAAQDNASAGSSAPDPHVWLDVQNVLLWTDTIYQALSELDPDRAAPFQANAEALRQELKELDAWIVEQVATLPREKRRLVTNHETLGYFARRYGFELVGAVYPLSPSAEPSARDLAALEDAIRRYGLHVLLTEGTVSPALADQVAADTGVRLVPLYTESLGPPGSGADTYVSMMRTDVQAIVSAVGK